MPTPEREKLRWLALLWGGGLGPVGFRRLVGHFGSVREVLEAGSAFPEALQVPSLRLTADQLALLPTLKDRLGEFEAEAEELHRQSIAVLCDWEEGYPPLLGELHTAPPVICMAGRLLPQDDPGLAIIGTRSPTPEGFEMARRLGAAFAGGGTTVISGLARGCDTAAHVGALEAEGRTIAILGSGIRTIHPRENAELAREISRHGVVISEQAPSAPPNVGRLMARNRLQSALARGVLVVEARAEGGALETAARAREQNRYVYSVKWPTPKPESAGNEGLVREGAREVHGPEDAPAIRLELADHLTRLARLRTTAAGQQKLF